MFLELFGALNQVLIALEELVTTVITVKFAPTDVFLQALVVAEVTAGQPAQEQPQHVAGRVGGLYESFVFAFSHR